MRYENACIYLLFLTLLFCPMGAFAENIDPNQNDSQYGYGENTGWLNAEPLGDSGPGIEVGDLELTGYIWAENIGWISLSCQNTTSCAAVDYGVVNDGAGNLSGFAWGENVGWINFNPVFGGVSIDTDGNFDGWAWGENIGWMHFRNISIPYKVQTSWSSPPPDQDGDGIEDSIDTLATEYSDAFSDAATTFGFIISRGEQNLFITDQPDPEGVRVMADPGGGTVPAEVGVCGETPTLILDGGDEAVVTCSSSIMEVISGPIEVVLHEEIVATVPTGARMTVAELGGGGFQIENSGSTGTILVDVLGEMVALDPGESETLGFRHVEIDIKPRSHRNTIILWNWGLIPVVIFSAPGFDAPGEVDRSSLTFGRSGDEQSKAFCLWYSRDVNRDRLRDLRCFFQTKKTGFQFGDTEGFLKGRTVNGTVTKGRDAVYIKAKKWWFHRKKR
jgi:hypothetical protein